VKAVKSWKWTLATVFERAGVKGGSLHLGGTEAEVEVRSTGRINAPFLHLQVE
jgi:hypothetical protein